VKRALGIGIVVGIVAAAILIGRDAPARRWWL
jgi:hypothetical protein